jgi:hypothetical protein
MAFNAASGSSTVAMVAFLIDIASYINTELPAEVFKESSGLDAARIDVKEVPSDE